MKKIVIYVVVFDPIKILVGWAHQNDCQNLSFVKAINVLGRKMGGRHFVDIIGDISWTKGVTFRGHFW